MRKNWIFLSALILSCCSFSAFSVDFLLQSQLRPTVSQYLAAFNGELPKENPLDAYGTYRDQRVYQIVPLGPELIAKLEFSYPGAIWAPLGRDSAYFADILEAYYLSIHEPDRVVRIHASTPSFTSNSDTPPIETRILLASNLVNSSGVPIKDFVILDPTSWSPTSQSRRLLQCAYYAWGNQEAYKKGGCRRVGAISLPNTNSSGNHAFIQLGDRAAMERFFSARMNGRNIHHILSTGHTPFSYDGDKSWHDRYNPPYWDGSHATPNPGSLSSLAIRQGILWWIYEVIKATHSREFHSGIESVKKRYGLAFGKIMDPFVIFLSALHENDVIKPESDQARQIQTFRNFLFDEKGDIIDSACETLSNQEDSIPSFMWRKWVEAEVFVKREVMYPTEGKAFAFSQKISPFYHRAYVGVPPQERKNIFAIQARAYPDFSYLLGALEEKSISQEIRREWMQENLDYVLQLMPSATKLLAFWGRYHNEAWPEEMKDHVENIIIRALFRNENSHSFIELCRRISKINANKDEVLQEITDFMQKEHYKDLEFEKILLFLPLYPMWDRYKDEKEFQALLGKMCTEIWRNRDANMTTLDDHIKIILPLLLPDTKIQTFYSDIEKNERVHSAIHIAKLHPFGFNIEWCMQCLHIEADRETLFSWVQVTVQYSYPQLLKQVLGYVAQNFFQVEGVDSPSLVDECNFIIRFMVPNSPMHIEFAKEALKHIQTVEEYQKLRRPDRAVGRRNATYYAEKKRFKQAHSMPSFLDRWKKK